MIHELKNQKGFAHNIVIAGLVILMAIGGAGYYVWSKSKTSKAHAASWPIIISEKNGTVLVRACKKTNNTMRFYILNRSSYAIRTYGTSLVIVNPNSNSKVLENDAVNISLVSANDAKTGTAIASYSRSVYSGLQPC